GEPPEGERRIICAQFTPRSCIGDILNKPALTATLHSVLVLFVVVPASQVLNAQPAEGATQTETKKASDVLNVIDQLIEQNRKLEQQNRELMEQINSLRQSVAKQDTEHTRQALAPASPVEASTAGTPADPTG